MPTEYLTAHGEAYTSFVIGHCEKSRCDSIVTMNVIGPEKRFIGNYCSIHGPEIQATLEDKYQFEKELYHQKKQRKPYFSRRIRAIDFAHLRFHIAKWTVEIREIIDQLAIVHDIFTSLEQRWDAYNQLCQAYKAIQQSKKQTDQIQFQAERELN